MMKNKEAIRMEMLEKPMGRLLLEKSYPTVIIQLTTVIYNTADTYFVSKINNQSAAAVGVVFALMSIIQAVGFGIGMGASSLISRCLGAQKNHEANVYGSTAVFLGFVSGILLMLLGLTNIGGFMFLIGASESVLPYAVHYGRFILIAAPFMCLSFVLNNILKAEGQSNLAMIGMTAGGVLNVLLDPLFIYKLDMGIRGAAIATMVSQMVSMGILSWYFASKKSIIQLGFQKVSKQGSVYAKILGTGFPTICRQGLGSVSTAILNRQAKVYGDAAVAAISIVNKIYMINRNMTMGIGQGYQPIAGYCYGAGKTERVKKAFTLSCIAGTLICTAYALTAYLFRIPLMSWFRDDEEVIAIGAHALKWFCMAMPLMAYSTYVNQTYQCLGFSVQATFLASCRQGIFFIPLALILPKLFGLTGIEILQSSADAITFLVSIPFQVWFFRKKLSKPKITEHKRLEL